MKYPQRRLALGVGTFLCLLIALCFGILLDLREDVAHLALFSSPSQLLSREVVAAEPKPSCPAEDFVDGLDLERLGAKYLKQAKYKLAQRCFEKWVSRLERNPKSRPLDLAIALGNVGWALQGQGENSQAIPLLERSLLLFQGESDFEKEKLIFWQSNLAYAKKQVGDFEDAEILLKQALAIAEREFGRESAQMALTLTDLGGCYITWGKIARALTVYKEALAIDERDLPQSDIAVSRDLCNVAECYRRLDNLHEAEPLFKRVLAMLDRAGESDSVVASYACNNLGELYFSQGRFALAEGFYQRALASRTKVLGARSPFVGATLTNYVVLLRKTNRFVEALKLEERARATYPFDTSSGRIGTSPKQELAVMN